MADDDRSTVVVSGDIPDKPPENPFESSPLSITIPDQRLGDSSKPKVDQSPNTSATSPAEQETNATTTPKTTKRAKSKKRVVVKKTARRSKWNADNILTDHKSPLASADLRSILSNPMAWDALEKEERAEILALFPDSQHIVGTGSEDACPDFASLMNDDSFRYDCAAYTENIAQGRHDPEWLAQAWAAHERRKMGDFDEYLDNKFKDDWNVELPPELKTNRSAAASNELDEVEMGSNKPMVNGRNDKVEASMMNGTLDKENDSDSGKGSEVDELPKDAAVQEQPLVVITGQQTDSVMDLDGEGTKKA